METLIRKRREHLARCTEYLRTNLAHSCPRGMFDILQERFTSITQTFGRIDQVLALLRQMTRSYNSRIDSNLRASFYSQIFRRLREIENSIGVLDEIWSSYIAFRDFAQNFSELYLIFSKLEKEISVPLEPSHFSMFLASNGFGYLDFSNVSKYLFRIYVPVSAIKNPSVWPILAHEIGHAFCFLPRVKTRIDTEFAPRISQHIRSICERVERSRESPANIQYILSRSWYHWLFEISADLFALRRIGPSFIHSQIFELMVFDPFSLGIIESGPLFISTHPPPDLRIKMLIRRSREWFPQVATYISECEQQWKMISSQHSSITLERQREWYDVLCNDRLMDFMEDQMVALLNETTSLQNVSLLSVQQAMAQEPISIPNVLLSVVSEAMLYEEFVEELIEKIKRAA